MQLQACPATLSPLLLPSTFLPSFMSPLWFLALSLCPVPLSNILHITGPYFLFSHVLLWVLPEI